MGTEFLGFGQYPVHFLERQALLVAVFRRPAAGAVHVAGGGRVHQDEPGDVDVVFFGRLLRHMIAADAALIDGVGQKCLEDVGVVVADQALDIAGPLAVGIVGEHMKRLKGFFAPHIAVQLLDHVYKIVRDLSRVLRLAFLDEIVKDRLERLAFGCVGDFFRDAHVSAVLSVLPGFQVRRAADRFLPPILSGAPAPHNAQSRPGCGVFRHIRPNVGQNAQKMPVFLATAVRATLRKSVGRCGF